MSRDDFQYFSSLIGFGQLKPCFSRKNRQSDPDFGFTHRDIIFKYQFEGNFCSNLCRLICIMFYHLNDFYYYFYQSMV